MLEPNPSSIVASTDRIGAALRIVSGVRLEAILALAESPADLTGLARTLDHTKGDTSRKLQELTAAGLVHASRVSKRHVYSLTDRVSVSRTPDRVSVVAELAGGDRLSVRWTDDGSIRASFDCDGPPPCHRERWDGVRPRRDDGDPNGVAPGPKGVRVRRERLGV